MSEEEYNYLKNNPTKATMIDKFGYIHLYNKNNELHKIASSQFIYKIIDELSKKEKIIDELKEWLNNEKSIGDASYNSIMEYMLAKIKELENEYD